MCRTFLFIVLVATFLSSCTATSIYHKQINDTLIIDFVPGTTQVADIAHLKMAVEWVSKSKAYIHIEGYFCKADTLTNDSELSLLMKAEDRAFTVYNYFIAEGIDVTSIYYMAFGGSSTESNCYVKLVRYKKHE